MPKDIAVIGGGLTGCLAALEFAGRGHRVVIFERSAGLLTRASLANEGKIHLGYTYAADKSFRTAERMVEDALQFRVLLERWISPAEFQHCLYDPFIYQVPANSALPVEAITRHFTRIEALARQRMTETGVDYLGEREFESFSPCPDEAAPGRACFLTAERGVWPQGISTAVSRSVMAHPLIEIRPGRRVDCARPRDGGWTIALAGEQANDGPFDMVVNCAWAERRAIDRRSGFPSSGTWYTRYKFGVVLEQASRLLPDGIPPNTTATSGPFGDVVHFPQDGTLYCSWYPVGMCFATLEETAEPPDFLDQRSNEMMRRTWEGCASLAPSIGKLAELPSPLPARLIGDFIMAKGQSDIEDPMSGLHSRSSHGATELSRGYWSIETGKYTSAPRCATECVRLSLGEDR